MKIALDCRMIGMSGIGTYIENIVDTLLSQQAEHNYLLIGNEKQIGKYDGKEGVDILYTDISPFSIKELLLFPVEKINKCDLFYSPYINIPGYITTTIYSTIHDVIFLDLKLTNKLGTWIRSFFYKRAIRLSKLIFTVSSFSKERIKHHFRTDKEIVVTYSAISNDLRKFKVTANRIYNFPYYVFVGNIKKHKGLKMLLDAYKIAQNKGANFKLVIIGSFERMKTSDSDIITQLKENENISFTGFIPNSEMYTVISQSLGLILPSHYEGFGLPPLEALYLGSNVILSDIKVLKEIYEDLPVTFFKDSDANSLANKLMDQGVKKENVEILKNKIDSKYSFKIISEQLINIFSTNL